jgi:predicted nuclease of predicted toxin-antitoxin system
MKLLFDQNLSPSLPRLLADLYPDSVHVRDIGLRDATGTEIWEYAKHNGFVLVSKDSDFQQRSLLFGQPPKFIWLRVGNCPVKPIE